METEACSTMIRPCRDHRPLIASAPHGKRRPNWCAVSQRWPGTESNRRHADFQNGSGGNVRRRSPASGVPRVHAKRLENAPRPATRPATPPFTDGGLRKSVGPRLVRTGSSGSRGQTHHWCASARGKGHSCHRTSRRMCGAVGATMRISVLQTPTATRRVDPLAAQPPPRVGAS